jgi:hypothetical protein
VLLVAAAGSGYAAQAQTGAQANVVFDTVPAFARNGELLRRLASPLQARRTRQALAGNPNAMQASPTDSGQQRFALYVPPGGYALLVFVPPWEDARVPQAWLPALTWCDRRNSRKRKH